MFPVMSVCSKGEGGPLLSLPMVHWTLPYTDPHPQTWDLTVQGHLDPAPSLVTSGGQDWKPVQTCSLEEPPLLLASGAGGSILLECFHVVYLSYDVLDKKDTNVKVVGFYGNNMS